MKIKSNTLKEVRDAVNNDWQDNEVMRQVLLNQNKFGNDIDDVDDMYIRVADNISEMLESKRK